MTEREIIEQIRALPPEKRRQIVERIEDEFADELTSGQIVELDHRSGEALKHPGRGTPAREVFAGIEQRLGAKE